MDARINATSNGQVVKIHIKGGRDTNVVFDQSLLDQISESLKDHSDSCPITIEIEVGDRSYVGSKEGLRILQRRGEY